MGIQKSVERIILIVERKGLKSSNNCKGVKLQSNMKCISSIQHTGDTRAQA